jgi:hypothetical protein
MSGETAKPEEAPGANTRENLENERLGLVGMAEHFHETETDHHRLIANSQQALITKTKEWQEALTNSAAQIIAAVGIDKDVVAIVNIINALLVSPDYTDHSDISLKAPVWKRAEVLFGENLSTEAKQVFINELVKLKHFNAEVDELLTDFANQTREMEQTMRKYRSDFYKLILHANELIELLPEYQKNVGQIEENKESLYFDAKIGEIEKEK